MKERWARYLVAVALLAGFVTFLTGRGPTLRRDEFCAGVGLMTDTYGATPREALEAYVRSRGGDPIGWRLEGKRTFRYIDERTRPRGFATISVSLDEAGVWRASGACVGNYAGTVDRVRVPRALSRTTCEGAALGLYAYEGRAHAPMATWEFTITNESARACSVEGHPTIAMLQNGYPLSFFTMVRRSGVLVTSPAPTRVELPPGGSAFFVLEKDSCAQGETMTADRASVVFDGPVKLEALVPGRFGVCADHETVAQTPVVASFADAYWAEPAPLRCRAKDLSAQDTGIRSVDSWTVRLVTARPCELRGTPGVSWYGPEIGLRFVYRGDDDTLGVRPDAPAYVTFTKPACTKPEAAITQLRMRLPTDRSFVELPIPAGLAKCDFKETEANVVHYGPFTATPPT